MMDNGSCLRTAMPRQAIARLTHLLGAFGLNSDHSSDLSSKVPPHVRSRVAAGLLAGMFLLAGCVPFLHHHPHLQRSTPFPILFALPFPAPRGNSAPLPRFSLS